VSALAFLDSGPLGLACDRPGKAPGDRCKLWIKALITSGFRVHIPEIIDYEVRRELIRIKSMASLRRLDALKNELVYVPLDTEAMLLAAEFWAIVRRQGRPTAAPDAIDVDCILAAQAATATRPGDSSVIATTNVAHLARFPGVVAQPWASIN
jgi:predicted nucleic acid-binding protein